MDKRNKVNGLSVTDVIDILKVSELDEYEDLVREKNLDGKQILNVTEGIVKVWRIKPSAKKFVNFVEDLKHNPDKYLELSQDNKKDIISTKFEVNNDKTTIKVKRNEVITVENNGTRISVTKTHEENITTTINKAEDLIYKIVPPKSFLYKNQKTKKVKSNTAYLPMNVGATTKKQRSRFFRFSSQEYPLFDLSRFKYFSSTSGNNHFNDRGYYSIKNQLNNQEEIYRTPAPRVRHKSQCSADEIFEVKNDKVYVEEHLYEDLCYNDIDTDKRESGNSIESFEPITRQSYKVRLQGIFHSFKMPGLFRTSEKEFKEKNIEVTELSSNDMYDSVHVNTNEENKQVEDNQKSAAVVEDYLVPITTNSKDYCDIASDKEESFVDFFKKIFENFGTKKDSFCQLVQRSGTDVLKESNDVTTPAIPETSLERPNISEPFEKWNETERKSKMAGRPLPVPVENEAFFMDVDRTEAARLLEGQEDGYFLLRPSSQPNHAYTLSVSCSSAVHNVGVRRRPDGRLALGYARKGERSFETFSSLLQYHRKKKLLLMSGGTTLGSTVLKDSPMYYQVPSNIPVFDKSQLNA